MTPPHKSTHLAFHQHVVVNPDHEDVRDARKENHHEQLQFKSDARKRFGGWFCLDHTNARRRYIHDNRPAPCADIGQVL